MRRHSRNAIHQKARVLRSRGRGTTDDNGGKATLDAIVHGRVQGVGFRYYTRTKATSLGLTGWVNNEPDGTVHVVCEGDSAGLKEFEAWLDQGPPSAHVSRVEKHYREYRGIYRTFSVEG